MSKQNQTQETKLADFVAAVRCAGAEVTFSLKAKGKKSLSERVQDLESAAVEMTELAGELWATCMVNLQRGTLKSADDEFFLDYLAHYHKELRRLKRILLGRQLRRKMDLQKKTKGKKFAETDL